MFHCCPPALNQCFPSVWSGHFSVLPQCARYGLAFGEAVHQQHCCVRFQCSLLESLPGWVAQSTYVPRVPECPLVRTGIPPPPHPQASVSPSPFGSGVGTHSEDWRKSLELFDKYRTVPTYCTSFCHFLNLYPLIIKCTALLSKLVIFTICNLSLYFLASRGSCLRISTCAF